MSPLASVSNLDFGLGQQRKVENVTHQLKTVGDGEGVWIDSMDVPVFMFCIKFPADCESEQ